MNEPQESIAVGNPVFRDTRLAQQARDSGPIAAWRAALSQGPAKAAVAVDGEFAVALREPSGRTFLAVDRFAIRTLCYRIVGNELRFALRADALVGADESAVLDPQAIFDYVYFHVIPSPRTIFKGVQRVPAGHYVLFENGQLTVAPYWSPTFDDTSPMSLAAEKERFRKLLLDSVAAQLDGSKGACFLSGGTDSSTVAGMIGLASGKPAATYSIGFQAEGYDEMAFARITAQHFKTEHHEYYVTPDDLVSGIPAVAAHYDQPFGNSSALPAYYCARMAHDDGVSRLLAGDGGDELFGGNTRYAKQRVFGAYQRIPEPMRRAVLEPIFRTRAMARAPLLRKGASYIEQARVPMPDRLQTYNLLNLLGIDNVFTAGFLESVDIASPARQQREVWAQAKTGDLVNRMLAFDWRYTLAETDLPKVCGTAQLANVSVGFPMLDARLLDYALRMPPDCKLKGLRLRWFFKEALRGFLPDETITKKKQGFGLPFGVWATRHDGLRRLASDSLGSLATRGIIRPEFLKELLEERLPSHPGYYGEMIWILMMLEQWIQSHQPRLGRVT
ncbi:asparagine synthetase B family protein [Scleromatobacter humisilvae]|uniref:asparagine synthase (glutamine-hydrolyzing) n=1 Tax=Scleromatobacter humisilvae TaxID=2897159 RepID=A0A9X1YJ45_9BURK|nr:asparagine synthase C-terminal domain-containing protein [Scleromatobacter humisilvae]MCK9686355.1 asparagine synthase C-terminal domain-containing protein [Scleromatobacter humisilvae]